MTYFCLKLKMYELKIYRGVMCHDNEEWCKKRNWLVSSKLTWEIWRILTRALENLKNVHFNRLLLTKAYNVWAKKKYREVMFDDTEDWCQIWRKTDLCFLQIFIYRLKNTDFILESKMAELNWKQNVLIYFENCQDVPCSHE